MRLQIIIPILGKVVDLCCSRNRLQPYMTAENQKMNESTLEYVLSNDASVTKEKSN